LNAVIFTIFPKMYPSDYADLLPRFFCSPSHNGSNIVSNMPVSVVVPEKLTAWAKSVTMQKEKKMMMIFWPFRHLIKITMM